MQRLYVGILYQAAWQESYRPTDHRKGISVDDRASSIKDKLPPFEVTIQKTKLLCHKPMPCLHYRPPSLVASESRVALRHKDRPEGGVNVRGEKGGPTARLSLSAYSVAATERSLGVLVRQIIEDRAGLRQNPAVILTKRWYSACRIER